MTVYEADVQLLTANGTPYNIAIPNRPNTLADTGDFDPFAVAFHTADHFRFSVQARGIDDAAEALHRLLQPHAQTCIGRRRDETSSLNIVSLAGRLVGDHETTHAQLALAPELLASREADEVLRYAADRLLWQLCRLLVERIPLPKDTPQ